MEVDAFKSSCALSTRVWKNGKAGTHLNCTIIIPNSGWASSWKACGVKRWWHFEGPGVVSEEFRESQQRPCARKTQPTQPHTHPEAEVQVELAGLGVLLHL